MSTHQPPRGQAERRNEPRRGILRPLLDALYRTFRWIGRHVHGFYTAVGLFLVLGLGLSVLALVLFAEIAEEVLEGDTRGIDTSVLLWMQEHTAPVWDALAIAGIGLGSAGAVAVVLLAGSILLWRSRHVYSLALLWISLPGGLLLSRVLKAVFDRPRPAFLGGEFEALGWTFPYPTNASFPSGHAITAVVVYGTLAYLVARIEPTPRMRRWTLAAVALLIVLIGTSRVYLGVHYPSDVIGGYLAGFIWATFCALGIEAVRHFRGRKPEVARDEKDIEKGIRPLREVVE